MSNLVCPLCGAFTSAEPAEFGGFIRIRSGQNYRYEHGTATALSDDKDGNVTYGILDCQGCGGRFVGKKDRETDEWSAAYPIKAKRADSDIDEPMKGEFEEAHLCFAIEAYRGCVSMCGTALEALWRDEKASSLLDLKEKGVISPQLYERANEIRLWGNIAKHELAPDVVDKEDAEELLTYLEAILNAVYVEPKKLERLSTARLSLKRKSLQKKGDVE